VLIERERRVIVFASWLHSNTEHFIVVYDRHMTLLAPVSAPVAKATALLISAVADPSPNDVLTREVPDGTRQGGGIALE
jgi:hypothetical protein